MANLFEKFRRKTDKEIASDLSDLEKEAEKEAKREAARAEYKLKRTLTVGKLFEIGGLVLPDEYENLREHVISDFTIDPRRLTKDSVFMFWGDVYDFDFMEILKEKEYLMIISCEPFTLKSTIYIPDSADGTRYVQEAFIKVSYYIKSIHKAKVISVTGSVGKTSTKEMIESVLRAHYKNPHVSRGNNNSVFSVSRNIQNLKRTTNVFLQEVGANMPGSVEISARQLEVDMAVYTNIGHSHIESYGTKEALIKDKLSLSDFGKKDGIAFINLDDEVLANHVFKQNVISYSLHNHNADYFAENICEANGCQTFEINGSSLDAPISVKVNVLGGHNVLNAVCAYAVGKALNLKDEEIISGIESYHPSGMRQNLLTAGDYHIFADCYNSSLMAVENTLSAMDSMTAMEGGRKIAVLGDVLELGELSEQTHKEIGKVIADHDVDVFLAYGIDIKYSVETASALGTDSRYFDDREKLEEEIKRLVKPEDLILFKASHGVNLGSSIDRLFGTDINESSSIGHKQFELMTVGDFEYYIFETSASIKTYLGTSETVTIPSTIEAQVTDALTEITQCKVLNIEKLGKTSFRNNAYVKEVNGPAHLIRIRDRAFMGSSIECFKTPETLLSIGSEAFASCENLKFIQIGSQVKQIGEKMLENSPHAVVKCKRNTFAEKYALESGYSVEYME